MKFSFEDCPRCHHPWGEVKPYGYQTMGEQHICVECGLRSTRYAGDRENYAISFGSGTYMIKWDIENKTSIILKGGDLEEIVSLNSDEHPVITPLLPFDITLEKLKLYLTFL